MTSWLQTPRIKRDLKDKQLTFQTTDSGFATQFNTIFYSYLYAKSKNTLLHMCDMPNALGPRYPMLRNTFDLPKDLQVIDTPIPSSMAINAQKSSIETVLSKYSSKELRSQAKEFFKLRPEIQILLKERLDILKIPKVDCTLHLKSDSSTSDTQKILQAVSSVKSSVKKQTPTIFVMTDDYRLFEMFRKKAETSWILFTLPSTTLLSGYNQKIFNSLPRQQKMEAYMEFLVELTIAQSSDCIVTSFSSNVGKYLYLTAGDKTPVISMDVQVFTPF